MLSTNTSQSTSSYEQFLNFLEYKSHGLKENIMRWQNIIGHADTNWTPKQAEKNILSWYKFNSVSYHAKSYKISPEKQEVLEKFQKDPYYIFKNMVEIMGRDLVSKYLRNTLKSQLEDENSRLEVFISSDADDVFSWVDLICKIQNNGEIQYVWIDIAVSQKEEYLTEKSEKMTSTKCIEFNMCQRIPYDTKMPRKVLAFSPKIMAEMLSQYLSSIEKGEYIDTLELYNNISKQNIQDTKNMTKLKVDNLLTL